MSAGVREVEGGDLHVGSDVGALYRVHAGSTGGVREERQYAQRVMLHFQHSKAANTTTGTHIPEPAPTSSTLLPLKSLAFIDTANRVTAARARRRDAHLHCDKCQCARCPGAYFVAPKAASST